MIALSFCCVNATFQEWKIQINSTPGETHWVKPVFTQGRIVTASPNGMKKKGEWTKHRMKKNLRVQQMNLWE